MIRSRIIFLLLCACLLGAKAEDFDVRILLATLALGILGTVGRYVVLRDRALIRFESRVDGALWGPEDANGRRNVEIGVVAVVNRLASDLPRAIAAAERAAKLAEEAAQRAQAAAALALNPEPQERRRDR